VQTRARAENGGILLGWRSDEDRIVADLRGPGAHALHGRHCFVPDHAWQVTEINRAFPASRGDLDYLGDWHSHPEVVAEMSDLDSATLLRIARRVPDASYWCVRQSSQFLLRLMEGTAFSI